MGRGGGGGGWNRDRHWDREIQKDIVRERKAETDRHREGKICRTTETDREGEKRADRQKEREKQTDRQRERKRQRQSGREREGQRQTEGGPKRAEVDRGREREGQRQTEGGPKRRAEVDRGREREGPDRDREAGQRHTQRQKGRDRAQEREVLVMKRAWQQLSDTTVLVHALHRCNKVHNYSQKSLACSNCSATLSIGSLYDLHGGRRVRRTLSIWLNTQGSWTGARKSSHKGANWRSKDVTQAQQQRPELPTVTLTWHACEIPFSPGMRVNTRYICTVYVYVSRRVILGNCR